MTYHTEKKFICPECGSVGEKEGFLTIHQTLDFPPNEKDPWGTVEQITECCHCGSKIPAHLAELWKGLTIVEAKKEWKERFADKNKEWFEYKLRNGKILGAMIPSFDFKKFMGLLGIETFVRQAYFDVIKQLLSEIEGNRNGTNISHLSSLESVIARRTSSAITKKEIMEWLNCRDWDLATFNGDREKGILALKERLPELSDISQDFPDKYKERALEIIFSVLDSGTDRVGEFLVSRLSLEPNPIDPILEFDL